MCLIWFNYTEFCRNDHKIWQNTFAGLLITRGTWYPEMLWYNWFFFFFLFFCLNLEVCAVDYILRQPNSQMNVVNTAKFASRTVNAMPNKCVHQAKIQCHQFCHQLPTLMLLQIQMNFCSKYVLKILLIFSLLSSHWMSVQPNNLIDLINVVIFIHIVLHT